MGAVKKAATVPVPRVSNVEARLKEIAAAFEVAEMAIKAAHRQKREAEAEIIRTNNECMRLKQERLVLEAKLERERASKVAAAMAPVSPEAA